MTPDAATLQKLAEENKILKESLTVAQHWIEREISERRFTSKKESTKQETRTVMLETDDDILSRIKKYFGGSIHFLSPEDIELLIESEINFSHLVRKKDLDGFMVTNGYQKILENIFESYLTKSFRDKHKKTRLHPRKNDLLEKTLYKVIHDDFRLSVGKTYQIFQKMLAENTGELLTLFRESVEESRFAELINTPDFWEYFTDIIETQAFGEKRHAGKITLKDTRFLREKITGNFESDGFLKILLNCLG